MLYYITDRSQFPGTEPQRRQNLLAKIAEAAACNIDFIQLREKDLPTRELELLARQALNAIRHQKSSTRLLINSRCDVALAVGADGVHLRSNDISVAHAKRVAQLASRNQKPETRNWLIAVSSHSEDEVRAAAAEGADFVVFAPVFEKKGSLPTGLDTLQRACQHHVPVLALGGVTLANAPSCIAAGAAGIAAIRLFQENNIAEILRHLPTLDR